jgi:SPOR domain
MADDSNSRFRSGEYHHRDAAGRTAPSDPLTELARLIGQNDPFAEMVQGRQREGSHPIPREPSLDDATRSHQPALDRQESYGDESGYARAATPPFDEQDFIQKLQEKDPPAPNSRPLHADPAGQFVGPSEFGARPYDPAEFQHGLRTYRGAPDADTYGYGAPAFQGDNGRGPMPLSRDGEFEEEPPQRRRGLRTVGAVLTLAIVGVAGAFGYRAMSDGPSAPSQPPVIRASAEPTRVTPPAPTQPEAAQAGRIGFDRFADRGRDEQLIRREETPVDPRELARSAAVRSAAPPPPSGSVWPGAPPAQLPAATGSTTGTVHPPSVIGEPRRVRTVPIRPEPSDIAASAPASAPEMAQPRQIFPSSPPAVNAATAPSRVANAAPESPLPQRPVSPPPARTPPPANAPLSLAPEANANAARTPAPSRDTGMSAPAIAPARQASVTPAAPRSGRFYVQVTSQRSEADAEAAYRSVQSKHSNVLGNQQYIVQRADLGDKGIYFRALVGPFASRDDAVQLCTNLKSAGGSCLIQTN